jgi:hypothetical protein
MRVSGVPPKCGTVREGASPREVPEFPDWVALDMPVQKEEVGAARMGVGVCVPFCRNGGQLSILKKPDQRGRLGNRSNARLARRFTGSVDTAVQRVVEEHAAITFTIVCRTHPD